MSIKQTYEELEKKVHELEVNQLHLKQNEKLLKDKKQQFDRLINTIPCAVYDYVRLPDGRNRFIYISSQCTKIFEQEAKKIIKNSDLLWNMVHREDIDRLKKEDLAANTAGKPFRSEVRIQLPSGKLKWIQLSSMPGSEQFDSKVVWSGVILDITDRKQIEEERNQLIVRLQHSLSEIKILKGILPICMYCKKIRDDKGYWKKMEAYIHEHSGAEFSHSICTECAKKYYPDYDFSDD